MYKIHRLPKESGSSNRSSESVDLPTGEVTNVISSIRKTRPTLAAAHSLDQGYDSLHSTPKLGQNERLNGRSGNEKLIDAESNRLGNITNHFHSPNHSHFSQHHPDLHHHHHHLEHNHQLQHHHESLPQTFGNKNNSQRNETTIQGATVEDLLSKSVDQLPSSHDHHHHDLHKLESGSLGAFDSMVCLLRTGWASAWRFRKHAPDSPETKPRCETHDSPESKAPVHPDDEAETNEEEIQTLSAHPTPPPPAPDYGGSGADHADSPLPIAAIPEEERAKWNKKLDFLLSIIGFAVDLANVWRFPYLCYKNGGGVFLIPYSLMLFFGALPLFFLELSMGQFFKSGPITLWSKINPALKGIGYCAVLISWYVSFYYNVIIGWTFYYLFATLTAGDLLPWQHCNNAWNTESCISILEIPENCVNCIDFENRTSAAEEFYERKLLEIHKSVGFSDMGSIKPELVLCMVFTFCLLYLSLFKGVKSSGKVVWVTAIAPYIILTILLIRGLFLQGAMTGIQYYLEPRYEKLYEPIVWTEAAVQVFFSIGVGFGVHLTYASFNEHKNNCYRDALVTAAVNSCTSFYSGFVIFVYLGYIADRMGKSIDKVAKEGYGLVFQVYPEAISTLPYARVWCILFFFMLITLGLDSAMGGFEAVITGLMDEFRIKSIKRETFTALAIFCSFLISLVNVTQGGGYSMLWFDTYSAGVSLLCSAFFEAAALVYIYGMDRFCEDFRSMVGFRPPMFWQICWKYISPVFLLTIIVLSISQSVFEVPKYGNYEFSLGSIVCGWLFSFSSVMPIPLLYAFYTIRSYYRKRVSAKEHHFQEISISSDKKSKEIVVFV